MKSWLFIPLLIGLALMGCSQPNKPFVGYHPNGYYCQQITTRLHARVSAHNAGRKLTPIGEARLMKQYNQYKCDEIKR